MSLPLVHYDSSDSDEAPPSPLHLSAKRKSSSPQSSSKRPHPNPGCSGKTSIIAVPLPSSLLTSPSTSQSALLGTSVPPCSKTSIASGLLSFLPKPKSVPPPQSLKSSPDDLAQKDPHKDRPLSARPKKKFIHVPSSLKPKPPVVPQTDTFSCSIGTVSSAPSISAAPPLAGDKAQTSTPGSFTDYHQVDPLHGQEPLDHWSSLHTSSLVDPLDALASELNMDRRQLHKLGISHKHLPASIQSVSVRESVQNEDMDRLRAIHQSIAPKPIHAHVSASAKLSVLQLAKKAVSNTNELEAMFAAQRSAKHAGQRKYGF